MTRLLYYGRGGEILDALLTEGCTRVEAVEKADVVIVETYDNQSPNPVKRLSGTITLVRKALDVIEQSTTPRMTIITDHSSISGKKREGSETGVAIDGVHGFGTLTAEVLSRRASNLGITTKVFRIHPERVKHAISAIKSSFTEPNQGDEYQVITLGA